MSAELAIQLVAYVPGALNLTALTEPGGAWSPVNGASGSDWTAVREGFDIKHKREGTAGECYGVYFSDTGVTRSTGGNNAYNPVAYDARDEIQGNDESSPSTGFTNLVGDNLSLNCGRKWDMVSDRRRRQVTVAAYLGDGNYSVKAHLTDGSKPDVTINIAGSNSSQYGPPAALWFKVVHRAVRACRVQFELRCLSGSAYSVSDIVWLTVPSPALDDRSLSRLIRLRGT